MAKSKEEKNKAEKKEEILNEVPLNKEEEENEENTVKNEKTAEEVDEAAILTEKLSELTDKYLRLSAEFDNFRKRTIKEKDSMFTDGKAHCATAFLPLLDNLERAIESAKKEINPESVLEGMEKVFKQLNEILKSLEIEEIPAEGEEFDPERHNAVMHIEDEAIDTNTVVEEFQKGYIMNGKVLRHSMVKVAN